MADLKRDVIKYIRDKAKAKYQKGSFCEICDSEESLDFHHFYGLTELFERWCRKQKIRIQSEQEVLEVRDQFIEEHQKELYDDTSTLCRSHHAQLHSVYGKRPALATAKKQARWVERQREKHLAEI